MADFTLNMTKTTDLDDGLITLFNEGIILSAQEQLIVDQFANIKEQAQAKTFSFTKYSNLSLSTTPLVESEDVTSVALSDTPVTITPKEYGTVVTTTKLVNLQSGGKPDRAAAILVGNNMGQTQDKLAILKLEAGTNEVNSVAEASLTPSDILTKSLMEKAYNKLRRANIPKISGDSYVMIAHPDVISDLRNVAAAGDWVDVSKYTGAVDRVFRNEVGFYKGFKVIENSNISVNTDAGSTTTDTYHCLCFGFNALGKAVSESPHGVFSGPFDKLQRFVNIGWYGVFDYGIVDSNALQIITVASSFGSN